jgi:hypothetical protein
MTLKASIYGTLNNGIISVLNTNVEPLQIDWLVELF